ncbi:unnamed protein product [Oikopleura dioica]|uniref:Uncharacterized protein n=1 Tax=Oikopleura dioica TaxID=34765 RepID=E4WWY0_OIKDI|nr:unnamed protein product [Oikopleura dioica]
MSGIRGAISNIRHYLNTIEREANNYQCIDQRRKGNSGRRRGNPNSYYQRQRTRHYRHESSDDEDEDEDDSEDESDEECDFETLSNELIDFYQRHGVDWYMTRYGAVGARGMGSRGGGDFCLYFNVNGIFVKAYEESRKKYIFDNFDLNIRRKPFKDLFRL